MNHAGSAVGWPLVAVIMASTVKCYSSSADPIMTPSP
jgi:hypothetical protein